MKTSALIGAVVVGGMLKATAALAVAPPGFEPTAETPRFKFYARGKTPVDSQKIEKFAVSLERRLDHKLGGQIQYFRYERPEDIATATGSYVAGLTYAGAHEIHTSEPFHAHEVVHLLASKIGDPGPFFREGLAVALGDECKWQGQSVHRLAKSYARNMTLRGLMLGFGDTDPQRAYPVAGSFVSFLIKKHGVLKVKELFASASRQRGDEAVRFESVFGQPLEQAEAAWRRTL